MGDRMKRLIQFRAKNKENIYVYGMLYNYGIDEYAIIEPNFKVHSVYEDTIDQFTGLFDKDGNAVYENDIMIDADNHEIGAVVYKNGAFLVDLNGKYVTLAFLLDAKCTVQLEGRYI